MNFKRNAEKEKQKPILLKIAPDLTDEQLLDIIDINENETKIAGVIANKLRHFPVKAQKASKYQTCNIISSTNSKKS